MAYRTEGGRLRRGASNRALYRSTRAVTSIRIFSRHIEKKGFYFIEDVIKPDELAELQVGATNMITRVPVNREAKADAKGRPSRNRAVGNLQPFSKWWFGVRYWLYKPENHVTFF